MPSKVINEDEEIAFFSKTYGTNRVNKIDIDKLIKVFCSLLRFIIIDLCGFCSSTTIADDIIQLVCKVNVEASKVLSEYLEVGLS